MSRVTLAEQIAVVQYQIEVLRDSFTDLVGPSKGKIRDPGIRREIRELSAVKRTLERYRDRKLWRR